jgi:hypothetical protein
VQLGSEQPRIFRLSVLGCDSLFPGAQVSSRAVTQSESAFGTHGSRGSRSEAPPT